MKLLVDCIPYEGGKSGLSIYVEDVVDALAADGHELTLLVEPDSPLAEKRALPVIRAPGWTKHPAFSMLWHLFCLPWTLRKLRGRFDGFIVTAANRRVCRTYPIPATATVHDLANYHVPGKYSPLRMFYLRCILPHYAKKAHHLVAISRSTARDMETFWGVPQEKTAVLYNAAATMPPPDPGRRSWVASLGLSPGKYILYVSRIEHPGKNHVRLIEAFEKLGRDDLSLVLAGSDWKDADAVHARAETSPAASHILFPGFMETADLREAYASSAVYVFPSLFEGFGNSLVMAMEAGAACACSNNGALGEIAGDVAETFPPEDMDAMADAIKRLLDEPPPARAERIRRGKAHAATFSWTNHVRGLVKLLESDK